MSTTHFQFEESHIWSASIYPFVCTHHYMRIIRVNTIRVSRISFITHWYCHPFYFKPFPHIRLYIAQYTNVCLHYFHFHQTFTLRLHPSLFLSLSISFTLTFIFVFTTIVCVWCMCLYTQKSYVRVFW